MNAPSDPLRDVEAEASDWIARQDRGLSSGEQAAFERWLRDPRNAEGFARCAATWDALPGLKAFPPERLAALMSPPPRRRRRAPLLVFTAAIATLAAAVVVGLRVPFTPVAESGPLLVRAAPANAEARVALGDGSVIIMRRGSRIEVLERADSRRVRLLAGEAEFTVKKDPRRPFVVHVGRAVVRDIGTVFDVSLRTDEISVLVSEGEVAILAADDAGLAPTSVSARQRAVVPVGGETAIAVSATDDAQMFQERAWMSRRLSFARTPLAEAVAAINCYNVEQIDVGDPSLTSLVVSGSVQSDNIDGFLRMLGEVFEVKSERNGRTITLRSR